VMQLVFCFQIHLFDSVDEGIVMVIYLHALSKQPFLLGSIGACSEMLRL